MTVTTSCSYSNGPYQWSAIEMGANGVDIANHHVGYGKTKDEAIADLARLLNERAEAAEQDKQNTETPVSTSKRDDRENAALLIESIIDRYGVGHVLTTIVDICDCKATHVAHTWQDAHLAKRWTHTATAVSMAAAKAVGL